MDWTTASVLLGVAGILAAAIYFRRQGASRTPLAPVAPVAENIREVDTLELEGRAEDISLDSSQRFAAATELRRRTLEELGIAEKLHWRGEEQAAVEELGRQNFANRLARLSHRPSGTQVVVTPKPTVTAPAPTLSLQRHLGRLPHGTPEADVRSWLTAAGVTGFTTVSVVSNPTRNPYAFAFITFSDKGSFDAALGKEVDVRGEKMKIEASRGRRGGAGRPAASVATGASGPAGAGQALRGGNPP